MLGLTRSASEFKSVVEFRVSVFTVLLKMDGGPLVKGYCRKDFNAVKEVFVSNLKSGAEENVQLCVYVGPELVIDLWGCRNPENPDQYGPNSLQVSGSIARQTFSCKMCSGMRHILTPTKTFSRRMPFFPLHRN